MATTFKSLFAFLLVLAIVLPQGSSQKKCSLGDIQVKQEKTGTVVQGKPEFKVEVLNACPCLQGQVKFDCGGFQTVEPVDPQTLKVTGSECLLNGGSTVGPFAMVPFSYAWDSEFQFKATSSEIKC